VWTSSEDIRVIYNILSFLPGNLNLLKRTALRTEFEDVTTATPDLYSKICSNGNVPQHVILQQQQLHMLQLQQQHLETQQQQQQQLQLQQQQTALHETVSTPTTDTNPSLLPILSLLPPTVAPLSSNSSTTTPPPSSPIPSPQTIQLSSPSDLSHQISPTVANATSPVATATPATATPTTPTTPTTVLPIIPTIPPLASPNSLTLTNANFHTVTNNAADLMEHQQQQMLALMQQQTQLQQQYNTHQHHNNVGDLLMNNTDNSPTTSPTIINNNINNNNVTNAAATDAQNLDIVG